MAGGSGSKRDEIRKGPWKAEEDEVLINHVKKYGPRDWSSIRSKGLLHRTGKSCRLRWVNKLRPNLKNGCKFSTEEEGVVIELQAEFGNKWARIATYLPGRTDNDVKNFWSSRQKRLRRILQSSTSRIKPEAPVMSDDVIFPAVKEEEEEVSSPKAAPQCFSSSEKKPPPESSKTVFLPEFQIPFKLDFKPFDSIPEPPPLFPPRSQSGGLPLFPESQNFLSRLEEPNFFNVFAPIETSEMAMVPEQQQFPNQIPILQLSGAGSLNTVITDAFFDDIPTDMFDDVSSSPPRSPATSGC